MLKEIFLDIEFDIGYSDAGAASATQANYESGTSFEFLHWLYTVRT